MHVYEYRLQRLCTCTCTLTVPLLSELPRTNQETNHLPQNQHNAH